MSNSTFPCLIALSCYAKTVNGMGYSWILITSEFTTQKIMYDQLCVKAMIIVEIKCN